MRKVFLFLSLILSVIPAACAGGSQVPTVLPTLSQQTTAPTVSSITEPSPTGLGSSAALTGTTWKWIGFTGPNEQVAVETPANYSLVFQQDGTTNITADCNGARGSYQVDGQSLKIQVEPLTKAVCPPGSRSDEFIHYLGSVAVYSFQDGNLYLDLMADGGTMVFAPENAVAAGSGGGETDSALLANPWQWVSFTNPVQQYQVESPQNYLLTFHQNGTVEIKADCNSASGTYTLDGSRISIAVGPITLAACPPGSRSEEFLKYLGFAAIYFYQPGELYIDLVADGGTLKFGPYAPGS